VIYLLDVNVLLQSPIGCTTSTSALIAGSNDLQQADPSVHLATCSITELGFVRIACGSAALHTTSALRKSI